MSNERAIGATLKGLHGPHFDHLEPIQSLYRDRKRDMNQVLAPGFAERWTGVQPTERIWTNHTADGYSWPTVIGFWYYNRRFQLMLPASRDETRRDETYADRHVALYYEGRPLPAHRLKRVLMKTAVLFLDEYEVFFGPIKH